MAQPLNNGWAIIGGSKMIFSYVRTSVWKENKVTMEMQLEAIQQKADELGLSQVLKKNQYEDRGISGGKFEERPGLQNLLMRLMDKSNKGGTLIVYRFNRLSRNSNDLLKILEVLNKNKIELISVMEPLPSGSKISLQTMMVNIYGVIAQFERDMTIENIISGLERKRREGKPLTSSAPYGYRYSEVRLVPIEKELKIIRLIYDLYLTEKMGYKKICNELNGKGYRYMGREFLETDIYRFLNNKVYFGVFKGGTVGGEYRGTHSTIVSEEEYLRVQEIKKSRRTSQKSNRNNWLRKKILCPLCNNNFTPKRIRTKWGIFDYYYCANPLCKEKVINAEQTEERVLTTIIQFITKNPILESTLEELNKKQLEVDKETKLTRRQLIYRRDKLFYKFEQEEVSHDEFIRTMNKFNTLEAMLTTKKKDLVDREFLEGVLKYQSSIKGEKLSLEFYSALVQRVELDTDYSIKAIYLKDLPFNIMKQEEFVL